MPLTKYKRSSFCHSRQGTEWDGTGIFFDAGQWEGMELGDYFQIPALWPPDRVILWEIDRPEYSGDFALVRWEGKRYIERIDK